ncbi:MAG: C39 family peptidase [Candidatus Yanofskybacteria bacterium]|nr:C39 family peptidase [Candidatus Yanofskybacteria bacterium]
MSAPTRSRILLGVGICAVLAAVVWRGVIRDAVVELAKPPVPSEQPRFSPTPALSAVVVRPSVSATPGPVNLAVPFSSQAPFGDWSLPWQEACEEASALLVDAYWRGATVSADSVAAEIQRLVAWEQERFGYYQHTTAAETALMLREVYGYRRVDVEYGVGTERIAEHVRAGRPVIVPLAGRLLGNKYYTQPGPAYHMLVVKGVAENGDIITNDVGTRHGRNLTYAPAVFLNAMHDVPQGGDAWPADIDPAEYIKTGRRAIIVVYPNE